MQSSPNFSDFIFELGGTTLTFNDTPFATYHIESSNILIHFIEIDYLKSIKNPEHFFATWLATHQPNYTKIIHLYSDVWMHKNELIKNRIKSLVGKNKRVFARQTTVVRLDKKTTDLFLTQHHLQGTTSAYYKFGLMHNNLLVAVATFSKARTMYDGPVYYKSYELERFAAISELNIVGGLSKLLKHFCNTTHAGHIMTYADRDWSNGSSYIKLGFAQTEITSPLLFWVDTTTGKRFFAREVETALPHLIKVYNTGSIKFIWKNT